MASRLDKTNKGAFAMKPSERNIDNKLCDLLCLNAPVLTGMKPCALISISEREYSGLCRIFSGRGLKLLPLYFSGRVNLLMYREERLRELLIREDIKKALSELEPGYIGMEYSQILRHFCVRFREFRAGHCGFPHELGLLLGYPIEDVKEYIRHDGENSLFTGYWKVYHSPDTALLTFQAYDISVKSFRLMLSHGIPVDRVLDIYISGERTAA